MKVFVLNFSKKIYELEDSNLESNYISCIFDDCGWHGCDCEYNCSSDDDCTSDTF